MKRVYGMAAAACFFWGTMAPVSKRMFSAFSNIEVLAYSSGIAAVSLFLLLIGTGEWRKFKQYSRKELLWLVLLGLVGYFGYSVFYYRGLDILPAQTACILNYLWPIFTALLSTLFLREPLTRRGCAGLLVSFSGVIALMLPSGSGLLRSGQLEGYGCCIMGALLYAAFNVLNKKQGKSQLINMFVYIGVSAVMALSCCAVSGLTLPTPAQIPGLLWLGVLVNAAAFLLWAMALQRAKTAFVANLAYATPVISTLLSVWFLGEPLYGASMIGLALILGGFFLR